MQQDWRDDEEEERKDESVSFVSVSMRCEHNIMQSLNFIVSPNECVEKGHLRFLLMLT